MKTQRSFWYWHVAAICCAMFLFASCSSEQPAVDPSSQAPLDDDVPGSRTGDRPQPRTPSPEAVARTAALRASLDKVFQERMELPRLYLTAKSHKRVIAPTSKSVFVDKATGEVCWPALVCVSPDCPGRAANGDPYIFIEPDPGTFRKTDGSLGYDPTRAASAQETVAGCPKCLAIRDLASESVEDRRHYAGMVRPHVLPETAARIKQLDAKRKRVLKQPSGAK
jgi:hypothetical protein